MKADLILLAAGSGSRMRGTVADKVLASIAGVPVFVRSWRAFAATGTIVRGVVVYRDAEQRSALETLLQEEGVDLGAIRFVLGGAERADSVRAGLEALGEGASPLVAVHDSARPLIRTEVIRVALEAAEADGAAVVAHPVVDTIKRVGGGSALRSAQLEDLDRSTLWAMETPQVFRRDWLVEAYGKGGLRVTDDTAAVTALGHGVTIVPNSFPNPKITRPEDLAWAEFLLESATS